MLEIAVLAALIVINGLFAMSELAIVSARRARLKALASDGNRGAAAALALAEQPGKFLSTVQIGITLIGILAGAFSGATLGGSLAEFFSDMGLPTAAASALGYGGIVAVVTYLSVVIGELVPKQFALRNAEAIACRVATPMRLLSIIAAPVVWLLDTSTRVIFRLLGLPQVANNLVTEEEIKTIVAEAAESGVIERDEKRMIAGVLRLSDGTARAVMTPRTAVDWIDITHPLDKIRAAVLATRHSRVPVADGNPDNIIGVIVLREVLARPFPKSHRELRRMIHSAPVIPDTLGALDVLDRLRKSDDPIALVHDEYGHFEGVVTPADMLEAIAGVFRSDLAHDNQDAVQREDGSWLIAGSMPANELADLLDIAVPARRDYQTAAGYLINAFQRLPHEGEAVDVGSWRLEIVDMDGRRIDKILAARTR